MNCKTSQSSGRKLLILEPAHVQTLFPQSPVKTLDSPVLRRLARLNVDQSDLPLHTPTQKMPAGELRAVIAADRSRYPALGDDRSASSKSPTASVERVYFRSRNRLHVIPLPGSVR